VIIQEKDGESTINAESLNEEGIRSNEKEKSDNPRKNT